MMFYKKAMEEKRILKGLVLLTQYSEALDSEILLMDLNSIKGIVLKEDVDYQMEWKSLVGFLGREIYYVVKEIDEEREIIYCSRKEAQEMAEENIVSRLQAEETFDSIVTGIVKYGAYVEIEGVYALLKNVDFSEDHIAVGDALKVGDSIKVKLKKVSNNNRLTVEPVEKYKMKTVMSFDFFERDQVVLGTVNGVKPWGAYVTISPGLDALCPIPPTGEIEEGTKVSFRITQVQEGERRIRGKIIRILQ